MQMIFYKKNLNLDIFHQVNCSLLHIYQLVSMKFYDVAIFSLFFGPFIDFVGKRRLFIFLNFFLFAATHLMLAIFKSGEKNEYSLLSIIPLITLGICFSMYCCVLVPAI